MTLREQVHKRVLFMGKTPGGCKLVLHNLLDNGRDIFQFMQLFSEQDIEQFYYAYAEEIDEICAEDEELVEDASMRDGTKLALEKTLMLIESEIKNANH